MINLLPLLCLASGFTRSVTSPIAWEIVDPNTILKNEFQRVQIDGLYGRLNVSILAAAPQAALLAKSLSFLAACLKDISLQSEKTNNAIRLLTTPRSFRASLYQVVQEIAKAFRVAHFSMLAIDLNLNDIHRLILTLIKAFVKPNEASSKFLFELKMKNFKSIVDKCTTEATAADLAFSHTTELITELTQVLTALYGANQNRLRESLRLLKEAHLEMEMQKEREQKYRRYLERHDANVVESRKKYLDITNEINGRGWGARTFGHYNPLTDASIINSSNAMYLKELEVLQQLRQEHFATQDKIAKIAAEIANANTNHLDIADIIAYMAAGVVTLGEIQKNWGYLRTVFTTMRELIVGPIKTNLDFLEGMKGADEASRHDSSVVKDMSESGLTAALTCSAVAKTAQIYNFVSKEFVLPVLDQTVTVHTLSYEEAKNGLWRIKEQMIRETNLADYFIRVKLNAAYHMTIQEIQDFSEYFNKCID